MASRFWMLLLCVCLCRPGQGTALKILVTGTSGTRSSHLDASTEIAGALASRGHQVWMIMDEETHRDNFPRLAAYPALRFAFFTKSLSNADGDVFLRRYVSRQLRDAGANSAMQYRLEAEEREIQRRLSGRRVDIFKAASFVIDDMLGNRATLDELRAVGFDAVLGDFVSLYHVFLGQVLGVPYIHIGLTPIAPSQHDRFAHNPSNPAYVPERMSFLADEMTFRERVKNTVLYWLTGYFYYSYMLGPLDGVLAKHGIRPDADMGQLISEARMWIFNSDFLVDFARPLSPHVKFVGGFLTGPSKPLNEEWLEFFDSSGEHGVVLLALGTLITNELTDEQTENIAASLALLPQKVVWAYGGQPPRSLGNNTKLVKWIPQNDLLGHPKTRAFISHGGLSSIHQSIYHAVPVVGIPVFGDQKDNFIRLNAKGMSVLVDIRSLSERTIYEAVVEVVYNESYKASAERLSAIARDRVMPMSPLEEVAYWVEYAIKHGTEHLRPRSMQLSLVQYYLLDVLAVTALLLAASAWAAAKLGRFIVKKATR